MSIVSIEVFTEYLKNETGVTDSAQIAAAKATAEGVVRQHCQRSFETATGTETARTYGPTSIYGCKLRVDDFADTAQLVVVNNTTTVAATDYQALPLNGLSAGVYCPYEEIELLYTNWYQYGAKAYATITANWGWTAVPEQVVEAVKLIGKDYVTGRTSKFGYIDAGGFVAQGGRNWLALNALAPYRRVEAFGIA